MATSLAEILRLSGIDPATVPGIGEKQMYQVVHATPSGEVLRGKQAVKAASEIPKIDGAPAYKIKFNNDPEHWLGLFITQDATMRQLKDKVRRMADLPYPVLIIGETGTGKELLAKALHGRRQGNFVPVNCGGFPEHLIESELFGHVKGAFTGAENDKQGLFQAAAAGTIFLDEIGELPKLMQCKLLRALQEQTIRRVGSVYEEKISCRIVAATHCNLTEMVKAGTFREDLLWRLNTFEIFTTPLRNRPLDIPLIAKTMGVEVTPDIMQHTQLSGNVRELYQIVLRIKHNL